MKNKFLILNKNHNKRSQNLRSIFSNIGNVYVITEGDYCPNWIKYKGMTSEMLPEKTAWEVAWGFLENNFLKNEYVWFIEDDVFGDQISFEKLIELSNEINCDLISRDISFESEEPDWYWWKDCADFHTPLKSFNPLCRLSPKLIGLVFDWVNTQKKCIFHEILFPSISHENGLKFLDMAKNDNFNELFSEFHWRPEIPRPKSVGISHPFKG